MKGKIFPWNAEAADRLRAASLGRSRAEIAHDAGISRQALGAILDGRSTPKPETAERIAAAVRVSLQDVLGLSKVLGVAKNGSQRFNVPVLDISAAAGSGRLIADQLRDGTAGETRSFDEEWLRLHFGNTDKLRLITVSGDSQSPLLEDGDEVMIDISKTQHSDGLAVVLLGDYLVVKRLQFAGRTVQLLSANPAYETIQADPSDENDFRIIGRVVWRSGRMR